MGYRSTRVQYTCNGGCDEQGCKGHTAELSLESTPMIYEYNDGKGMEFLLDSDDFHILYDLMTQMIEMTSGKFKY